MKRISAMVIAGALLVAPAAAQAKQPDKEPKKAGKMSAPPTKMKFKLDGHQVEVGETLTGSVVALSGRGKDRAPLGGATLDVVVDKTVVGSIVTDADGGAEVTYVAQDEGEHVMKVVYAGDDEHKRAKRAQGFEVGSEEEDEILEDEELDEE